MNSKHLIHQLIFSIEGFKDNSEFQNIANKLSSLSRSSLESRINTLFDRYSIKGYHILISELVVDLEYININNLENSLLIQLEKQLTTLLRKIRIESEYKIKHGTIDSPTSDSLKSQGLLAQLEVNQKNTPVQISKEVSKYLPQQTSSKVLPEDAKYFDAVIYFLEYGWLPKYMNIPMYQFDTIFTETLIQYNREILKHFGRKSAKLNDQIQKRIIQQVSSNTFFLKSKKEKHIIISTIFRLKASQNVKPLVRLIEQINISKKPLTAIEKTLIINAIVNINKEQDSELQLVKLNQIIESRNTKQAPKYLLQDQKTPIQYGNTKDSGTTNFQSDGKLVKTLTFREEIDNILNKRDKKTSRKQQNNIKPTEKVYTGKELEGKERTHQSSDKTIFKSMPKSQAEQLEEKLNIILNSDDKRIFNELLETTFFKSLVKSYNPKTDSTELLMRKMLPLIQAPNKRKEILQTLPNYIDSEEEIINQLYKKTPSSIVETLKSIKTYEKDTKIGVKTLGEFLTKLSKKRINLILKSFISYFSNISPTLNYLNKLIAENNALKNSSRKVMGDILNHSSANLNVLSKVPDHKYVQIQLIILFSRSHSNPVEILQKYFSSIRKLILKKAKLSDSKLPLQLPSKLKDRIYKNELEWKLTSTNIERDYNLSLSKNEEIPEYMLTSLIRDNYMPSINNRLVPFSIVELLDSVEKSKNTIKKSNIKKLFKENKIYKNPILVKLNNAEFRRMLGISLSTDKARVFIKLFEKYHYLWKTKVDNSQIQLIFLSLIKYEALINEKNIFSYFYEELKVYKSWTYDVHKKLIIETYENHVEKLGAEIKETLIEYIDSIPTYQSLEFRDTKKKLQEGIPIKNAGLVLLWPFFKTLFNVSGYLDKSGDFKDLESRERATLLLQYLAVMSSAVEEPYLALNKIMTGFPLEDSLPQEIILTDKEKDIADALLLNVIKQWPSFENSSTDNLRGSFIIRDGILSFRGNQWVLRVDNKSYDLLLNKLPWGFSMIRLTWIPYIIKVEWN